LTRLLPLLALALVALAWLGSGVMFVDAGQKALVYRFGAVQRVTDAGLRFRLPAPLEHDERINVTEVRRVEPASRRLLTGDTNLVQLRLSVQYTVSDPARYVLAAEIPEDVISAQVMSAAVAGAAGLEVDTLLTTGRSELQRQVLEAAQQDLTRLDLGVRLVAVDVQELVPPPAVVDAFNDVSSARGDKETLSLSAEAYASKLLPDVRGEKASAQEAAMAEAARRLARARAETTRFRALHEAWMADREGTRVDLHAQLLELVGPELQLFVAPADSEIVLAGRDFEP